MKLLILGGTVFLGRAIVEAAQQRGHTLTLFNRGQSRPGMFPEVEQIHGDRTVDLSSLKGRTWDAVIDTSGYVPRHVRRSASELAGSVGHYTFISTLSVYDDWSVLNTDESGHLGELKDEMMEEVTGETYGPLKARCEKEVEKAMQGRALVVRPGLIVGPNDPTDRFTYFPVRVSKGGEVLAPGRPERGLQFIDVRDLAEFVLKMTENKATGAFNATGPRVPVSMDMYLQTSKTVSGSDASFTWVSEEFLLEHKVGPWIEMPMWLPELDASTIGGFTFNINKALSVGLTFRPMEETLCDTIQWAASRPADHAWRAGLTAERERELLEAWKA